MVCLESTSDKETPYGKLGSDSGSRQVVPVSLFHFLSISLDHYEDEQYYYDIPVYPDNYETSIINHNRLQKKEAGAVSVLFHLHTPLNRKFWDEVNFGGGRNTPKENYKRPPQQPYSALSGLPYHEEA